jgi:hypothetical protein
MEMTTNEEIKKKYQNKKRGISWYYYNFNTTREIDDMLNEARDSERANIKARNEIHEKYHELNDKDIEDKAYMQGYKEGIAHCERRDNNPIFNWYVKEYLKEEFLHLDSGLLLQEPIKVFADKLRLEGYKQGQIDAITHLFENKIAIVRAVKVLSEDMQDAAKKAEFIKRWNEHIATLNRLLWSCEDSADYEKTSKEIKEIQERLMAIVERLSLNVK